MTTPCEACRYPMRSHARYCRRCGQAQTSRPEPIPVSTASETVDTGALRRGSLRSLAASRAAAKGREAIVRGARGAQARFEAIKLIAVSHRDSAASTGASELRRRTEGIRTWASSTFADPSDTSADGGLAPRLSARTTFTRRQLLVVTCLFSFVSLGLVVGRSAMLVLLIAVATAAYLTMFVFRARTFWFGLASAEMVTVSDEEARGRLGGTLPIYTVLVPAYREPEVMERLIAALDALEYPRSRLDIKLLLEADDAATIAAAAAVLARRPKDHRHIKITRIPYSEPRTKPKACLVGLAGARGTYVTIYDAEDRPDPLQLRRAAVAFSRLPESVACLQARLSYHNADQNLITRWFTAEYAMWFGQLLPGLVRQGVPVPLGGTSNHLRTAIVEKVGGWDPYNVTEDADLGIRLHRQGYRTGVLDSVTLEEANSDFVNWIKQRSRWYKGYLQTWLVHLRNPRRLWREIGARGFIGFNLFVGGTPLIALLNPVFWVITAVWFLARPEFVAALFPAWLYYASMLCLVAGNFLFVYGTMVSARSAGRPGLVLAAMLVPIYWVMMSIAAIKAVVQLVSAPSFWEKTTHGLDVDRRLVDRAIPDGAIAKGPA